MNLWESSRQGAMGQSGHEIEYCQRVYWTDDSTTHSIPITGSSTGSLCTTGDTLYIDDTEAEAVKIQVEEPPDEFTQLSNHKFHELLDKFSEMK